MVSTVTYSMTGVEPVGVELVSLSSSTTSNWVDTDGERRHGHSIQLYLHSLCYTEDRGEERGGGERRNREEDSRGRGQAPLTSQQIVQVECC